MHCAGSRTHEPGVSESAGLSLWGLKMFLDWFLKKSTSKKDTVKMVQQQAYFDKFDIRLSDDQV